VRLKLEVGSLTEGKRNEERGKSAEYFKHSSLPLGRNEVYRSLIPTTIDRSGDFYQRDNTYVKPFQPRWTIYDTKRQKIVTF
jgi:hypothetical protein